MKHRAVKRRAVVMGIGATAGAAAVGGLALTASPWTRATRPSSSPTRWAATCRRPWPTAALDGLGDDVDHVYYWDEGHGSNTDPGDFIAWIARVTGHGQRAGK
ncbi:hypothetical protein BKI49_26275 [Streptomyces sp. Tue6028]|uniref:hypothetical protein n=1 Tax=Streptomyces sp. Tue6028 TaxID=2036037 RepID=UPI000BB31698|nr:hypothetical protein [Streptomyces sp. Tue6028]PBC61079.1 hypothetical protein BKI49_26275 [Streptomyces sp. Tue6028]